MLSQRRADTAKNFLVTHAGLESSLIQSVGYGKTRLLADKSPYAADQRRIEVQAGG